MYFCVYVKRHLWHLTTRFYNNTTKLTHMNISYESSDKVILREIGSRIARHRLNRNMTQDTLAEEAGISTRTVTRIEQGQSTQTANLIRILRVLRLLENLDAAIPQAAMSPVQQARMQGRQRKRASPPPEKPDPSEPWSWGNEDQ